MDFSQRFRPVSRAWAWPGTAAMIARSARLAGARACAHSLRAARTPFGLECRRLHTKKNIPDGHLRADDHPPDRIEPWRRLWLQDRARGPTRDARAHLV